MAAFKEISSYGIGARGVMAGSKACCAAATQALIGNAVIVAVSQSAGMGGLSWGGATAVTAVGGAIGGAGAVIAARALE